MIHDQKMQGKIRYNQILRNLISINLKISCYLKTALHSYLKSILTMLKSCQRNVWQMRKNVVQDWTECYNCLKSEDFPSDFFYLLQKQLIISSFLQKIIKNQKKCIKFFTSGNISDRMLMHLRKVKRSLKTKQN